MSLKQAMDKIVGRGVDIWGAYGSDDDEENASREAKETGSEDGKEHTDCNALNEDRGSSLFAARDQDVEQTIKDIENFDWDDEALRRVRELERLAQKEAQRAMEQKRKNARDLINRVMKSPFEKNRKIILLKAFMKWHKVLPLNQKCDELAKILQDRLVAVASIRDSYLRDIVRVKHHLQKIQEYQRRPDRIDEIQRSCNCKRA